MVEEDGSDLAIELWGSAHPAVSSILAYPEGRAALAAAQRAGRLPTGAYARVLADFEKRYEDLVAVGVDHETAQSAGAYAESFGLRGYDAVHLATALELGEEAVVVTWDEDLRRAAEAAGLAVAGAADPPS